MNTALHVALRSLRRNAFRASLTATGITMGTAAVIATVAIGEGGRAQIHQQLLMLGDNLVWIEAGGRNIAGTRTGSGSTRTLLLGDMLAVQAEMPELLKACSPQVDGSVQVIRGHVNWRTTYRGVTPEYLDIRRWFIATGESFTGGDVESAANVCLLGRTVATQLFGQDDPVGQPIRVGPMPFRVVGTLAPKGQSTDGRDQDDFILLPFRTGARKLKGAVWLDDVMCSAVSTAVIPQIEGRMRPVLRERHHLVAGQEDDFNIRKPEDAIKAQEEMAHTLTMLLASVATISLIVGGVGIMNIMLVSVTERTREIGLRLAVGARSRDIRMQFLAEAVVLCLAGGGLGILLGALMAGVVADALAWPVLLSADAAAIAAGSAAITGLVFGYYPARKASRQDPIDALRYE